MKQLFALLLVFYISHAQGSDYFKAKIVLTNGQRIEGFAQLPSNKFFDNSIRFKREKDGSSRKIKDKEIDKALYVTESGNEYLLERRNIRNILRSFGKVRENTTKKKFWILLSSHHSQINYYYYAMSYIINKNEVMIAKTVDRSGTWADVILLLKRPGETAPTMITSISYGAKIIGKEKKFRKYASIYFSEHPDLVKRIQDKEFEHDKMEALIEAYIALKKT